MTLLFLEGFDHHGTSDSDMDTVLEGKWTRFAGAWERVDGRLGGYAGATNFTSDFLVFGLPPNTTEVILGFAIKFREINADVVDPLIVWSGRDGSNIAILRRSAAGKVRISNNPNNVHYDASVSWKPFAWNYIEVRLYTGTSASNGTATVRLNGQQVLNITGADFNDTTNEIGSITVSGTDHFDPIYDDIYILDTNGTTNNTFLGDVKVETLFPSAAGLSSGWSVTGAANNHTAVSEEPVDFDTSYVSTSTVSEKDTHAFDDLSTITQNVKGIQINTWAKKTAPGNRVIKPVVHSGSTDYDQGEIYLPVGGTDEYGLFSEVLETDPDTSLAWTVSNINSAEFGYKLTT